MSFSYTFSAQHFLLSAAIITVEVDLSRGLNAFTIVGLPDKGVAEAKDRVSAAIKNSGYDSPKSKNQKVVISLAPASIRKEGAVFDLAIALAYLQAANDISFDPKEKIFLGELSLDGKLCKIQGVLPQVIEAKKRRFKELFLPKENATEAALIEGIDIFAAESLNEVIEHINVKKLLPKTEQTNIFRKEKMIEVDMGEIKGQEGAKRGLEIAASGGHNIALYGPPGTGKTMLAKAFRHLLPALTFQEILDVTSIHSVAGISGGELITEAPFRAPHHTASYIALVGGGATLKPGEITLAHRGILFLDEFPEFDRKVIEVLRQPLEEKAITLSRARGSARYPANFILIATMNPCPCGNFGSKTLECRCGARELLDYERKISGPIVDRIDMWIEMPHIDHRKLKGEGKEKTEEISQRVCKTREVQARRLAALGFPYSLNSEISPKNIFKAVNLTKKAEEIMLESSKKLDLSTRSYHRVLRLSRTIADMEGKVEVEPEHVLEALQYRPKKKAV